MNLSDKTCVPCQGGMPPLNVEEAERLLAQTPGWSLIQDNTRLEKRFIFNNFAAALAFVNRVGEIAEQEGHHPDISFGWGYAKVVYFTHKIGGLHENDFVMAAKTNALFG
jgi:4a-hydroxytetrahydrobiopterin dehydratase